MLNLSLQHHDSLILENCWIKNEAGQFVPAGDVVVDIRRVSMRERQLRVAIHAPKAIVVKRRNSAGEIIDYPKKQQEQP
jgi:hypothetical protein